MRVLLGGALTLVIAGAILATTGVFRERSHPLGVKTAQLSEASPAGVEPKTPQPALPTSQREAIERLESVHGTVTWWTRLIDGTATNIPLALDFYVPDNDDLPYAPSRACPDVDNELLAATLPYLPELEIVHLRLTNVDDNGMEVLLALPHLKRLFVTCGDPVHFPSRLTDVSCDVIGRHPNLEHLYFLGQPVTDSGIQKLTRSKTLRTLVLENCAITSRCFEAVADMENLRKLGVGRNPVCRVTDNTTPSFSGPVSEETNTAIRRLDGRLQRLALRCVDIHPSLLQSVAQIKSLNVLRLTNSRLRPTQVVDVIDRLPNLTDLGIHGDSVDEVVLEALWQSSITSVSITPDRNLWAARIREVKPEMTFSYEAVFHATLFED